MIDSLLGWLNLTELGVYVIMTFVFMIALIFVEIYGLKNRRSWCLSSFIERGSCAQK